MIRNKKHSELQRSLNKWREKIANYDKYIGYYYELKPAEDETDRLMFHRNVHYSIIALRKDRAEAHRKCLYLKRMIGEAQREYSRLNQKFSIR